MNLFSIYVLKALQHSYLKLFPSEKETDFSILNIEEGCRAIYQTLASDNPCMIARYGATELSCILNYLAIKRKDKNLLRYIKGESEDWWWNSKIMAQMERWSGFFPPSDKHLSRFCELMLEDSRELDMLAVFGSTFAGSRKLSSYYPEGLNFIYIISLDSFVCDKPWTKLLKGLHVLVIHPFAELIESQYHNKREELFSNADVLPLFHLRTIKAVQSLGGINHGFKDWFEALEWMKKEMDKEYYDIALIGCGAYGFPLAAHAKRTGHKAVHIGGSLQLLFGIKGKRWENPLHGTNYGLKSGKYSTVLDNPAWVRPNDYMSKESEKVEGGCYW